MTELFVRDWWRPDERFLTQSVEARLRNPLPWLCPSCYAEFRRRWPGGGAGKPMPFAHDCIFVGHHPGSGLRLREMDALRRIAHGKAPDSARFGMTTEEAQALIRDGIFTRAPARLYHGTGPRRRHATRPRRRQTLEEATT